ncbi:MAG: 50S ribosomal protein L11 methyltransferase [Gammaproteobacteria bacterium]|nr:50S ribosomal protein L11 methyltransferase [Gammaproteobacteria bacterium]
MWLQLKFELHADEAERLADLIERAGAVSVTMQDAADQPLYEPALGTTPLWKLTWVLGLFEADTDIDAVLQQIETALGKPLPEYKLNPLEDKDWVRAWLDDFKPMRFGENLWIIPSTFTPPNPEAVNILLDPGLAFGTGTHPTTAMCLSWLDAHPPLNKTVIDYGCGSGILAIAACKLKASQALGVDTDPQALLATESNALNNQVEHLITTCLPRDCPTYTVDLLMANILAGPLEELAPALAALVRPEGQIILSGILETQTANLIQAYTPYFDIQLFKQQDEWICLEGIRKP